MSTPNADTARHSVEEEELGVLQAAVARVERVLVDLDNGGHASSGRDFGRGVAYAARLITEALNPAPAAVTLPDAGDR